MTTKHTPGPWTAIQHYNDAVSVIDKDGFAIVDATELAILLNYSEKLGICHWSDSPLGHKEITEEEQAANSYLIAAAPELLEALQNIVTAYDAPIKMSVVTNIRLMKAARAAIAKATGESE